jgi:hypothetical protein
MKSGQHNLAAPMAKARLPKREVVSQPDQNMSVQPIWLVTPAKARDYAEARGIKLPINFAISTNLSCYYWQRRAKDEAGLQVVLLAGASDEDEEKRCRQRSVDAAD